MHALRIYPARSSGTVPAAPGSCKQRVLFVDDESPNLEAMLAL